MTYAYNEFLNSDSDEDGADSQMEKELKGERYPGFIKIILEIPKSSHLTG